MSPDPLQLLTVDQAAGLLGVHRGTVRWMIAAGDLEAFRWRNTTRVYRQELERFIGAHTTRARQRRPAPAEPTGPPAPPAAPAQSTPQVPPARPTPHARVAQATRSIVVLDDDEHVRRFLAYALSAEGYVVQPCASYDELLHRCSQSRVDLIIADTW